MAELRKKALLQSGVQIEGLQQATGNGAPSKKVVYGNRKKKGPAAKGTAKEASPAPVSRPGTPDSTATPPPETPKEGSVADDEVKDDWDASSEDESKAAPKAEGIKDSWDASSDDEDSKAHPPPPVAEIKPKGIFQSAILSGD